MNDDEVLKRVFYAYMLDKLGYMSGHVLERMWEEFYAMLKEARDKA